MEFYMKKSISLTAFCLIFLIIFSTSKASLLHLNVYKKGEKVVYKFSTKELNLKQLKSRLKRIAEVDTGFTLMLDIHDNLDVVILKDTLLLLQHYGFDDVRLRLWQKGKVILKIPVKIKEVNNISLENIKQ